MELGNIYATTGSNDAVIIDFKDDQEACLVSQPAPELVRRSSRARKPSIRLHKYEVLSNTTVNTNGEFLHFALLVESEPVSCNEALNDPN